MLSWSDLLSIELRNKTNPDVTTLLREREILIADHHKTVKRMEEELDRAVEDLQEQLSDALSDDE